MLCKGSGNVLGWVTEKHLFKCIKMRCQPVPVELIFRTASLYVFSHPTHPACKYHTTYWSEITIQEKVKCLWRCLKRECTKKAKYEIKLKIWCPIKPFWKHSFRQILHYGTQFSKNMYWCVYIFLVPVNFWGGRWHRDEKVFSLDVNWGHHLFASRCQIHSVKVIQFSPYKSDWKFSIWQCNHNVQ